MADAIRDLAPARYDDLRAVFINCTLKKSPNMSHTQGLMERSIAIMEHVGISVESIRAADYELPPGVQPDMTEHGYDRDDWPAMHKKVMDAQILVLACDRAAVRQLGRTQ